MRLDTSVILVYGGENLGHLLKTRKVADMQQN